LKLLSECQDEELKRELLRIRCFTDTELFAYLFFPHYTFKKGSEMHGFQLELMRDLRRGQKNVMAAPRGNAKSTNTVLIKVIHRIVYQLERYIVITSDIDKNATDKVMDVRAELTNNELLIEVYGSLKTEHWLKQDIVTANGVRVQAFAARSNIRGVKHGPYRPTWIIFDDVENRKNVKVPEQRADQWDWFSKDALKAGTMGETNFDFIGTVLHQDSLLSRLLKSPGWRSKLYRAVISWPDPNAQLLWDRWRDIYTDLTDADREEKADEFYRLNEKDMLDGVRVLWPEHQPFVELQKIIVNEGKAAFNTELMNNPVNPDTATFDMDRALKFKIVGDNLVRSDGRFVKLSSLRKYMYHDPAFGSSDGDYGVIVVGGVDEYGYMYILDAYIRKDTPSKQITAAFELAARWNPKALGMEANNGWALLKDDYEIDRRVRAKAGKFFHLDVHKVVNVDAKAERIGALEPKIDNRWIAFNEELPVEFIDQFIQHPTHSHDDAPDATAGLVLVASDFESNLFGGSARRVA